MKGNKFNVMGWSLVLASLMLGACTSNGGKTFVDPLAAHIDTTVRAQDDFWTFANGTWLKENPIPASEKENGIFTAVADTVREQVLEICKETSSKEYPEGSNEQKVGDLYFSGMDSVALNTKGISDLKDDLDWLDQMGNFDQFNAMVAYINTVSSGPLFSFYVGQDDMNSNQITVSLGQGGTSMPSRGYYENQDENSKAVRNAFLVYAKGLFERMGLDEQAATKAADKQLEIETALALASRHPEDMRDPYKNYNKMSIAKLQRMTPQLDWDVFFKGVGLEQVDSVVVGQPEFFTALNKTLNSYSLNDWKNYLKFCYLDGLTSYLDDDLYMKNFNFYSKTMNGIQEPSPRWKRVVNTTNRTLGDLLGQVYVERFLPQGVKEKFLEIGHAVRDVFAEHIQKLDWMSDATKEKALNKLNAINEKLAYPDRWKDYSELEISRDSYVQNMMNARKWSMKRMVDKYGKPVERWEWHMQPQTYNAYYSPSNNEICIPGCNIIVPGFNGQMPDDAILYAIIGSTFGHEITHGFDDGGCNYDAEGNLKNWWTEEDKKRFDAKAEQVVKMYSDYTVVDSLHINGKLTLGENIADLGGTVMAFEAFQRTDQYKNNVIISGYTPAQRFFLGYALAWMEQMRPEALATQVKNNEHSPAKWRVLAPLSVMPEFYEAFGVKEGDAMWRPESERVRIW